MLMKWTLFVISVLGSWGWSFFILEFVISRFRKGEIQTTSQWGGVIFMLILCWGFALGITFLLAVWIRRGRQDTYCHGDAKKKIAFLD